MPRNRYIRTDLLNNDRFMRMTRDARLFYTLFLTQVDEEGRFAWSTVKVHGVLFTHDDDISRADVNRWFEECTSADLLTGYEVDGNKYVYVNDFDKQLRNKDLKSHLPAPACTSAVESQEEVADILSPSVSEAPDERLPATASINGNESFVAIWESIVDAYPMKTGPSRARDIKPQFLADCKSGDVDPHAVLAGVKAFKTKIELNGQSSSETIPKFPAFYRERLWEHALAE